jgi:hypothetical protein
MKKEAKNNNLKKLTLLLKKLEQNEQSKNK